MMNIVCSMNSVKYTVFDLLKIWIFARRWREVELRGEMTKKNGVIDAAIWVGYAWGDAPRNHAVVMTYGDDKREVIESAEELANDFWNFRHEFEFVAPTTTLDIAFDNAFDSFPAIDDDGNGGGGGGGDVVPFSSFDDF